MTHTHWTDTELTTAFCPHCRSKGLLTNGARVACHACGWERSWTAWMQAVEKRVYRK